MTLKDRASVERRSTIELVATLTRTRDMDMPLRWLSLVKVRRGETARE